MTWSLTTKSASGWQARGILEVWKKSELLSLDFVWILGKALFIQHDETEGDFRVDLDSRSRSAPNSLFHQLFRSLTVDETTPRLLTTRRPVSFNGDLFSRENPQRKKILLFYLNDSHRIQLEVRHWVDQERQVVYEYLREDNSPNLRRQIRKRATGCLKRASILDYDLISSTGEQWMYRRSLQQKMETENQYQFLQRLSALPVMETAVSQLAVAYTWVPSFPFLLLLLLFNVGSILIDTSLHLNMSPRRHWQGLESFRGTLSIARLPVLKLQCFGRFVCRNTKSRNALLKYTFEVTEAGVTKVANTAKPIVNRFEKPSECWHCFRKVN